MMREFFPHHVWSVVVEADPPMMTIDVTGLGLEIFLGKKLKIIFEDELTPFEYQRISSQVAPLRKKKPGLELIHKCAGSDSK